MHNLIHIFKLMSDETRLRIITLLFQDELCVCQLSGITEIAQPKVSKALAKLRDLNLVADRRVDKFVYYTMKRDHALLTKINVEILESIQDYPQLETDRNRLPLKESFLSNCSTTTIK